MVVGDKRGRAGVKEAARSVRSQWQLERGGEGERRRVVGEGRVLKYDSGWAIEWDELACFEFRATAAVDDGQSRAGDDS